MHGFKSPGSATLKESFQIFTYNDNKDGMDRVINGLGTTAKCQKPCKNCLLNETTCTECYANSKLKYLQSNDCYRDCDAGTFGELSKNSSTKGYVCSKCNSECETCKITAS